MVPRRIVVDPPGGVRRCLRVAGFSSSVRTGTASVTTQSPAIDCRRQGPHTHRNPTRTNTTWQPTTRTPARHKPHRLAHREPTFSGVVPPNRGLSAWIPRATPPFQGIAPETVGSPEGTHASTPGSRAGGTTAAAHALHRNNPDGRNHRMQLIPPRGIRVAASFPGRRGGCQGSSLFDRRRRRQRRT